MALPEPRPLHDLASHLTERNQRQAELFAQIDEAVAQAAQNLEQQRQAANATGPQPDQ